MTGDATHYNKCAVTHHAPAAVNHDERAGRHSGGVQWFAFCSRLFVVVVIYTYCIWHSLTDVNYAEDISSLVTAVIRARRTSNRCSEQGQSGHVAGHRSHQQAPRRCKERRIRCHNGRCGRRDSVSGDPAGDGRGSNVRVTRDATATARADMNATGGGGYYRKLF